MSSTLVTFFPVGDIGGMALIRVNSTPPKTILVDCCISDKKIADYCDVKEELYSRLPVNRKDQPYVDAFILTHRHEDHLRGIQTYFHLGSLSDYVSPKEGESPKIVINELWSSDLFWKPESDSYQLGDDAKAFNREMKRRVNLFSEQKTIQEEGDRAIIIGKSEKGTERITYSIGTHFNVINNSNLAGKLSGLILGPIDQLSEELDEDFFNHNRQSIIMQLTVNEGDYSNKVMLASDAECLVWETLWDRYKTTKESLEYDLLVAPHHCSWHSLSYDSQSQDENPQVNDDAKNALSQAKEGAFIVSQSKPITDKDSDPPSTAAKDEYVNIVGEDHFYCTDEYPEKKKPEPLEFRLTSGGLQMPPRLEHSKISTAAIASTRDAYPHG